MTAATCKLGRTYRQRRHRQAGAKKSPKALGHPATLLFGVLGKRKHVSERGPMLSFDNHMRVAGRRAKDSHSLAVSSRREGCSGSTAQDPLHAFCSAIELMMGDLQTELGLNAI